MAYIMPMLQLWDAVDLEKGKNHGVVPLFMAEKSCPARLSEGSDGPEPKENFVETLHLVVSLLAP